jgi:hypothetical protein
LVSNKLATHYSITQTLLAFIPTLAKTYFMRLKVLLFALLFTSAYLSHAQQQPHYKGSLTYTLGKDTSAIGNYELNGRDFTLTEVSIIPTVNVSTLKGTFFPDGELKAAAGMSYDPSKGADSLEYAYKLTYERDTTFLEIKSKGKTFIRKYPVKIMVANSLGGDVIIFMPALLASFAPKQTGDSVISSHIVFNSARKFIIKKTGEKKLLFGSSVMGMFTLFLDKGGRLKSVDGIGTSFNRKGNTGPYLNIDAVIASNVNVQRLHPPVGVVNILDSAKSAMNGAEIKVIYSRPSVRGRVIFGEVVPWNRVWRTGADAATKISLSKAVYFEGRELPAGEYSIFTVPGRNGWTLLFNKQASIWGTEHNAAYDFLKVPMKIESLNKPVELMTIEVAPNGNGGSINLIWDKVKASVGFTTVK